MRKLIDAVVPDEVAAAEVYADPPGLAPLPEEEPLIARSVAKRRNEFVTVRYCARLALGCTSLTSTSTPRPPKAGKPSGTCPP